MRIEVNHRAIDAPGLWKTACRIRARIAYLGRTEQLVRIIGR